MCVFGTLHIENFFFSAGAILLSALLCPSFVFANTNSGITYHGRILKPNGQPELDSNVQFKMQVRTPGAEDCLIYEETQTINMAGSLGAFSVSLNDGTGTRIDTSGYSIDQVFAATTAA